MKNQYFGDVNDFRKYGLLRALTLADGLRLGVCWMLTDGDRRTDGRFLGYLGRPQEYRGCDPELFDWLKQVIEVDNERQIVRIEKSNLLGKAVFHSTVLTDCRNSRQGYFDECLGTFRGCDLVFFDPDNGLEIRSRPQGRKNSCKHLYWDEVQRTFETGSSVLIYQHFIRENRLQYTSRIAEELMERTGAAALYSFKTPHVLFVMAVHQRHTAHFDGKPQKIREAWGRQIEIEQKENKSGSILLGAT